MPTYHYKYGGSTWSRTLQCPGWRRIAALAPDTARFQTAADRGTLLHAAVVHMHANGLQAERLVGYRTPEVKNQDVTQTDARRALIPAFGALMRFMGRIRPAFEVEVEHVKGLAGGTADAVGHTKTRGRMADFKFGSVRVRAASNNQLAFYASAYKWPDSVRTVELAIIQPGMRPVLDVTVVSRKDLDAYARNVRTMVRVAESPTARLARGPECEWCPGKRTMCCPEWNKGAEVLDPERFRSGFFKLKGGMTNG